MPRPKDESLQEVFLKADEALSEIKDSRLVMKLLAIRGYSNQQAKDIAALFNTQTRTVYKWVELFRLHGIQGLQDKPKGHRKAILEDRHMEQISKWLDSGETPDGKAINWTLDTISQYINTEFGIVIKKSALSNTLRKMRYVIRKPRPTHAKSTEQERSDFKKNSRSH
ncbi:MAG TPA: winged helix-turn-helix domain-containing protein [Candidatus Cloacimonadota bacterium]|nr:winged helix-turn-helix domain-containing protein [Candidatus Cloacimonadota bacterium]